MADEKPTPTAEEVATWASPKQVLEAVVEHMTSPSAAREAILHRLRDGILEACAQRGSIRLPSGQSRVGDGVVKLSADVWAKMADDPYNYDDNIWQSGDLSISVYERDHHQAPTTYTYYSVRLHPDWRQQLLPSSLSPTTPNPPPIEDKYSEAKRTPVSKAALEAWFKAYKLAFPGPEDTEAKAMESAQGCFPGKSFSRDDIRNLRGAQKRGRKPSPAN